MAYNWYMLKVVTGREKSVIASIGEVLTSLGLQDSLGGTSSPSYSSVRVKNGKKLEVNKSVFSGYIMIQLELSDEIISVINSVSGVAGFVSNYGSPVIVAKKDVDRFISGADEAQKKRSDDFGFQLSQRVKIISGPFESFVGDIISLDREKKRLKVMVSIFDRPIPVDLDASQVRICNE